MSSLSDPQRKIERAQLHLDALDAELRKYYATQPYRGRIIRSDPRGCYVFGLRIEAVLPANLSLILGDFVHNLRAALDHIAWILDPAPDRRTAWPVLVKEDAKEFKKCVGRLPSDAQEIVKQYQPYRRADKPDKDLLWLLHNCWIIDKHHAIPIAGHRIYIPTGLPPPHQEFFFGLLKDFKAGEVEVSFPFVPDGNAMVNPTLRGQVRFGLEEMSSVSIIELRSMLAIVQGEIIPRIASYLEGVGKS